MVELGNFGARKVLVAVVVVTVGADVARRAKLVTALQTQLIRMQQMQTRRAPLTGPADNLTTKAVAHAMGLGKE